MGFEWHDSMLFVGFVVLPTIIISITMKTQIIQQGQQDATFSSQQVHD